MFLGLQLGAQPGPYATDLQVGTELRHPLFCSFSLHHHMDQLPGLDFSRWVWLVASLSGRESEKPSFTKIPPRFIFPWTVHSCHENQEVVEKRVSRHISHEALGLQSAWMCQGNRMKRRALYFGPSAHTKEQSWLAEPWLTETPWPSPGFQSRLGNL